MISNRRVAPAAAAEDAATSTTPTMGRLLITTARAHRRRRLYLRSTVQRIPMQLVSHNSKPYLPCGSPAVELTKRSCRRRLPGLSGHVVHGCAAEPASGRPGQEPWRRCAAPRDEVDRCVPAMPAMTAMHDDDVTRLMKRFWWCRCRCSSPRISSSVCFFLRGVDIRHHLSPRHELQVLIPGYG